jgi:uncharacterized protein (TIGR00297 family)
MFLCRTCRLFEWAQPLPEWELFLLVLLGMMLCVGTAEILRSLFKLSPQFSRKFVHVFIGLIILFLPGIFIRTFPVFLLCMLFILLNRISLRMEWLKGMHGTDRRSIGTVLYPASFVVLVFFFWENHPEIAVIAMSVMAFGDGAASIIGESVRSPHIYRQRPDGRGLNGRGSGQKSLEGSIAMFLISVASIFAGITLYFPREYSLLFSLLTALTVAVSATAWEALSLGGWDNVSVPLASGLLLACFLIPEAGINPQQMMTGTVFAVCIGAVSRKLKFLTADGSVATALLAVIIFGIGGWKWTVPILFFFLASSVLSKIGKKRKAQYEGVYKKTSIRDSAQVAANGGIGGLCIVLQVIFPACDFYPLYLGSLAAVTADTWGSEIGLLRKTKTYSLTSFQRVEQGVNGGVSMPGFVGGCLGSFLLSAVASVWTHNIKMSMIITVAGIMGSAVDSILGGTVQAAFRCPNCKAITEKKMHCALPTEHVGGLLWFDNEIVNYCCAITGCLVVFVIGQL